MTRLVTEVCLYFSRNNDGAAARFPILVAECADHFVQALDDVLRLIRDLVSDGQPHTPRFCDALRNLIATADAALARLAELQQDQNRPTSSRSKMAAFHAQQLFNLISNASDCPRRADGGEHDLVLDVLVLIDLLLTDAQWEQIKSGTLARRAAVIERFVQGLHQALTTVNRATPPATSLPSPVPTPSSDWKLPWM